MRVAKKFIEDLNDLSTDISEVSFALSNNISTYTDVTGVSFDNAQVRSAEIEYSIFIDADTDLYESGKIFAVQKGSNWFISRQVNGDNSQITLDINASGQLQYKSVLYAGFISGTLKVRARTTTI